MGNGMRRWLDVALTALLLTFDRKRSADGRITTFAYGLWPCRAPSSFVPYSPACGIITVTSHWTTLSTFFSNGMNGRQAIHVARTTKCNKIKKTSNFFLCVWRAISGRHNTHARNKSWQRRNLERKIYESSRRLRGRRSPNREPPIENRQEKIVGRPSERQQFLFFFSFNLFSSIFLFFYFFRLFFPVVWNSVVQKETE